MEYETKRERVRRFLADNGLAGVVIRKVSNFAWLTAGGSNFVALHTDVGASSLLLTREGAYLLANNIETPRLADEEVGRLGLEQVVMPWYEDDRLGEEAKRIAGGPLGSDVPLDGCRTVSLDHLHYPLVPEEIERYRLLGEEAGKVVSSVCRQIVPGWSEFEVAAEASRLFWQRGIQPVVLLVAADERIGRYRHPLATARRVKKTLLVVVCCRRAGLIVSLSRLVSFGAVSDDLARRHRAVCEVDAAFISGTKVGRKLSDVFADGIEAYGRTGFPDEWRLHHQGGPTGYATRYSRATMRSAEVVSPGQAYAWNPSITGTKSEDTVVVTDTGTQVISADQSWPMVEGLPVARPDILVREG